MDEFGAGLIVVFLIAIIGFCGGLLAKGDIRYDCKNYGKTEILGKWHECRPMDEKK